MLEKHGKRKNHATHVASAPLVVDDEPEEPTRDE